MESERILIPLLKDLILISKTRLYKFLRNMKDVLNFEIQFREIKLITSAHDESCNFEQKNFPRD